MTVTASTHYCYHQFKCRELIGDEKNDFVPTTGADCVSPIFSWFVEILPCQDSPDELFDGI